MRTYFLSLLEAPTLQGSPILVWTNIVLDYLQILVESMSNRMKQSKI